ncbi:radical SAM/SPASM domain-containing protein [Spirillospora sp. NPDC050679]
MRNEFFGALLYDRSGKDYYHLDPLSSRILTSPHASASELGAAESDVRETLAELAEMQAVGNTEFLGNAPLPQMLSAPMRVFYEITYRCPESCKHCYTESDKKDEGELSLEEKLAFADQLVEMGCFRVSIAGGEPLVDRDFFPFLEHALDKGIDVSFSTNATLITERVAKELAALDIRTINVSLDGWDEETFGVVRGAGRLRFVQRGVARLREHYRGTIAAKCTLMKTNLDHVDDIIRVAAEMGFDTVKFNCVREAGRALGTDWLAPTQDEYLRVIEHLADRYNRGDCPIKMVLPVNPYQDRRKTGVDTLDELGFGCYAGKESFCVTPVGDITPCSSFGRGEYVDGNIRTMSLQEAWLHGRATTLFRGLDGSSACSGCSSYDGCRGGCYLRSLRSTGQIDGTDPYCYERKNDADIDGAVVRKPVFVSIRPFRPARPSIRRVDHDEDVVG